MSRIDVFRHFPSTTTKNQEVLNERGMRKYEAKNKPDFSDSEIRDKIAKLQSKNQTNFNKPVAGKKLGVGFMQEDKAEFPKQSLIPVPDSVAANEAKVEKEESEKEVVASDINKNDPNDTNTTEKLKMLMSTGGFKFNEKEKAALGQILQS